MPIALVDAQHGHSGATGTPPKLGLNKGGVLLTPPLFNPNFGGVPVAPECPCWASTSAMGIKLFVREIIFEEFQPIWSRYLNVTDRQTDGRTTCSLITTLRALL